MSDESDESDRKSRSFAAMPGILVMLTLGYLFVMHAGYLAQKRSTIEWAGRAWSRPTSRPAPPGERAREPGACKAGPDRQRGGATGWRIVLPPRHRTRHGTQLHGGHRKTRHVVLSVIGRLPGRPNPSRPSWISTGSCESAGSDWFCCRLRRKPCSRRRERSPCAMRDSGSSSSRWRNKISRYSTRFPTS